MSLEFEFQTGVDLSTCAFIMLSIRQLSRVVDGTGLQNMAALRVLKMGLECNNSSPALFMMFLQLYVRKAQHEGNGSLQGDIAYSHHAFPKQLCEQLLEK